jgi:RHS repeat-associated protein
MKRTFTLFAHVLVLALLAQLIPAAAGALASTAPSRVPGSPTVSSPSGVVPASAAASGPAAAAQDGGVSPAAEVSTPAVSSAPTQSGQEGWSSFSHWKRNADGTVTTQLFATPAFRRTGAIWSPIDTTVRPTNTPAEPFAANGALRPIRFGASSSHIVELGLDGGPVTISAPTLAISTPDSIQGGVSYRNVAADTDLQYRLSPAGVKEELILRSAAAPGQFTSHISDPSGQFGTLQAGSGGSYRFATQIDSQVVVGIAAPVAYEQPAAGKALVAPHVGLDPASAHMIVVKAGDGYDVTVTLDPQWLVGKHFPVVLDPTITLQPDAAEAQVYSGCNACNPSPGDFLDVATDTTDILRPLVRFDTSSIPANSTVSAATLGLYWDRWCILDANNNDCYSNSYTLELHQMMAAWDPATVTWSSSNAGYNATVLSTASHVGVANPNDDLARWFTWDATSLAQQWVNGKADNFGSLLRLSNEALGLGGLSFYSSTAGGNYGTTAERPYLSVTYTPPGSANPLVPDQLSPAAARLTYTPTLQARYQDPNAVGRSVFFQVRNQAGSIVASGSSAPVASGATASFTPPALPDGTYTWRAQANNGSGYSSWSAYASLRVAAAPAAGPGIGEQRFYQFEDFGPITDRMGLHLNVANGNLVVQNHDLAVRGTKLDLGVDHYYNSASSATFDTGSGWVFGTGADVGLDATSNGSEQFEGSSGYRIAFAKNPDGSFVSPTGSDATLVKNGDATFTMTFHLSGERFNFTTGGYLSSDVDMNNNRISFAYSSTAQLSSITDTQNRVTSFTYNAAGLVAQMTDSAGRTYLYGYDASGNLTTYTNAGNVILRFTYDASHRLTQINDALGDYTAFGYDAAGRVNSINRSGTTTRYTYNAGSTVSTDPNGHQTTYSYDSQGRVSQVTDPLGNRTQATYSANSNVTMFTDATGKNTTFSYDGNSNLTATLSPTGASDLSAYSDSRHPYVASSHTSAQANVSAFTYDSPGNVKTTQNALATQNLSTASYNANGTLASVTDAKNNLTTYSYDPVGNLTSVAPPLGVGAQSFTYDGLSRIISLTDAKAQTTVIIYDALDRVTRSTASGGSFVGYTYDADGNLTQRSGDAGTNASFTYDYLNRPITKSTSSASLSVTYDGVGNLVSSNDSGGTTSYSYNPVDLLTSITEPNAKQTTFDYDTNYRRLHTHYPNGVSLAMTYDASGRGTGVTATASSGSVITSFSYSYTNPATGKDSTLRYSVVDASGNITRYAYDVLDRLTEAQTKNSAGAVTDDRQYGYDPLGNRTTQTVNGVTTPYFYNTANQMTAAGATTYSYDLVGNETANSAGLSFAYNTKNQTTSVATGPLSSHTMAYAGDGQSERVQLDNTSFATGIQGLAVATDALLVNTYYVRDDQGTLLAQRTSAGDYYYVFDGLGSVVALTDSLGNVVNRYQYDPYGNLIGTTTEAVSNPWKFTGGYLDSQTGLYKFGARYYDPTLGRWTQPDPLSSLTAATTNPYTYAGNNPVNNIDPTGTFSFRKFLSRYLNLKSLVLVIASPIIGAICLHSQGACLIFNTLVEFVQGKVSGSTLAQAFENAGISAIATGGCLILLTTLGTAASGPVAETPPAQFAFGTLCSIVGNAIAQGFPTR